MNFKYATFITITFKKKVLIKFYTIMDKSITKIDCLIISTGRAASTAIYQYINHGCELNLPKNKEPHHWFDMHKLKGLYPLLNKIYIPDRNLYFDLYSKSETVIDASCGYFFYMSEVIENLKSAGEMPKVIFLYRDPVSRSASIFNEWKKKGLTSSKNVIQDAIKANGVGPGFWWEYYYDNVFYLQQFQLMKDYFKAILLVNYRAFAKAPATVFKQITDFLELSITCDIDYKAINSSAEAKLMQRNRTLLKYLNVFPLYFQKKMMGYWESKSKQDDMKHYAELPTYLPKSIKQYTKFRESINNRDVVCINK